MGPPWRLPSSTAAAEADMLASVSLMSRGGIAATGVKQSYLVK